jgi:hypothetical protein
MKPEPFRTLGYLWRFRFDWRSDIGQLHILWSDGGEPPCYNTVATLFPCRHTVEHATGQDGTEWDRCTRCDEIFNYDLTEAMNWSVMVTMQYWPRQRWQYLPGRRRYFIECGAPLGAPEQSDWWGPQK